MAIGADVVAPGVALRLCSVVGLTRDALLAVFFIGKSFDLQSSFAQQQCLPHQLVSHGVHLRARMPTTTQLSGLRSAAGIGTLRANAQTMFTLEVSR
jgi:hypothetical protein